MDYFCNPKWNVCGGKVIPPHHLEYVLIKEKKLNEAAVGRRKHTVNRLINNTNFFFVKSYFLNDWLSF